jgi:hypothetical protein
LIADFDHPFIMDGSYILGNLRDAKGYHAPEVMHDDENDITIDGVRWQDSDWECVRNMSGQDSYHGACFHASEFIGSGLAEEMSRLSEDQPQVFVIVSAECERSEDDPDPEPAGWVILYRDAVGVKSGF